VPSRASGGQSPTAGLVCPGKGKELCRKIRIYILYFYLKKVGKTVRGSVAGGAVFDNLERTRWKRAPQKKTPTPTNHGAKRHWICNKDECFALSNIPVWSRPGPLCLRKKHKDGKNLFIIGRSFVREAIELLGHGPCLGPGADLAGGGRTPAEGILKTGAMSRARIRDPECKNRGEGSGPKCLSEKQFVIALLCGRLNFSPRRCC